MYSTYKCALCALGLIATHWFTVGCQAWVLQTCPFIMCLGMPASQSGIFRMTVRIIRSHPSFCQHISESAVSIHLQSVRNY